MGMKLTDQIRFGWLPALSLLFCAPGLTETVYRSVDEHGVVNFSDSPPAGNAPVETLVIDTPPPRDSELTQQRLEDMRETTDRMVADRMAREKHRAELRQMNAEAAARRAEADLPGYAEPATIISGYYPIRRSWRRHHRPRPEHPIARPPLRPPGVRPLPGNDYPASLVRRHYPPPVRAAFR